ncbi:hypothetical protein B0A55_04507 [Friedmanniomyces simplex]|uniref:Nucleoporin n=1 Tax=Friedmanniomyces simplex TaxID=329884 RepID=A0A4U0XMV2_9PEZI|nr:hypothetical protein B0A55_04507 [Friedmanniomyces simplex]
MEHETPIYRLQSLQRDLIAFSESRLTNVARLSAELDASVQDLRKLLDRKGKNEKSRQQLVPATTTQPDTLKIEDVEYRVNSDFRQSALAVADELNLDELDAAKLCVDVSPDDVSQAGTTLALRAVLHFHDHRRTLLECLRLILQQYNDALTADDDGLMSIFQGPVDVIMKAQNGPPDAGSGFWNRCVDGLTDVERFFKSMSDRQQTMIMTGQVPVGDAADALQAQQLLLTRQHESLVAVLVCLLNGRYAIEQPGYRSFISKAATFGGSLDFAMHYVPALIASAARLGSNENTQSETSHSLHKLFEAGPAQQQWKLPQLKAVAIVTWLAEYSRRYDDPTADPQIRVADRQKAELSRSDLFMQAVKDKAFHFLLAVCKWLKPEVWHDPAKLGLVDFLLSDASIIPAEASQPAREFVTLSMREFQGFTDALVSNMPDIVRRLKSEEDDQRRLNFSSPPTEVTRYEPDLERFIVIMSYAYQDDPETSQDFWSDRDSNLHGFLRWVSQRLPTPRVAAFCELLTSISSDQKAANQAHRFLLEDTAVVSGKLRKTYSVSWTQIFAELDTYASSLRSKPTAPQTATQDGFSPGREYIEGVETGIMLEAYLRLASHICRVSPEARNWLLREQTFHLGEIMFQLASSGIEGRIQASCFNLLSAMLTEKVTEVNDGMWVMLDNWIAAGGPAGSTAARQAVPGRATTSEKHYLQRFNERPETATAFVALLNALINPSSVQVGGTLDALPFPESLGAPSRNAGVEAYVDFAVGTAFRHTADHSRLGIDSTETNVLRYTCLEFVFRSLTTFNEDLLLLANATNIAVDSAIKVSSLATYARLHPFARVMEWLFNSNVITALCATVQQNADMLNGLDFGSPQVQATLKGVQVMNLAMRLQATYFDVVRPIVKTQSGSRAPPVANAALASFDDVVLSQLGVVVDITGFAASNHAELSLESLSLLHKLAASRKLSDAAEPGSRAGNRLIGALAYTSDAIASELVSMFEVDEFEIEIGEPPLKLVKAQAVLDMLNSSLDASLTRPTVAHCLLGFSCGERTVNTASDSAFAQSRSLFHAIAACSATLPMAVGSSNLSWLLGVKRGCQDIVNKLALSPLTANSVRPEILSMDLVEALSKSQIPVTFSSLWDLRECTDPETLLESSAVAIRDFLKSRELFFEYAALQLRIAAEQRTFSVQESTMSTLQGVIRLTTGEQEPTMSIIELFDFLDLETAPALEVTQRMLSGVDLSVCVKDDLDITTAYDLKLAEELLVLRKQEIISTGQLRDVGDEQQLDDEIRATLASLLSQNNFRAVQAARVTALEAWTELFSLMMTSGGLEDAEQTALALLGLQTILGKFEKSLSNGLDAAALLGKLTLALVRSATPAMGRPGQQITNTAHERLLSAFRVSLKAITESSTGLGLRDVCYRTCIAVTTAMPLKVASGKPSPSPHARQLLQLVHHAGDRLLVVSTEDAFSGRGSTRVSAVMFLDALMALSQASAVNAAMLKALSKLNFVPVLIDTSIGSVASSFQSQNEELRTTLAYFHTALSLLLRICSTADGTQLVLNSGFFSAITDSRLFSTDPDIGLDIDNAAALREFYKLLSAILRVVTATVVSRGASNAATLQQAKCFLQQNRFSIMAIFKRTSAVQKTSGPPEREALSVAEETTRLMLVTGFLEDDESAQHRAMKTNGFT